MTMLRFKPMMAVIPVIACAVLLLALASPAAAQSEACIHLLVGTSYSTTIRVLGLADDLRLDGSNVIDAGQTQCVSLAPIRDGTQFVVLALIPGTSADCTPPPPLTRSASLQTSITFNASGTAFDPHCVAPTGATPPQ